MSEHSFSKRLSLNILILTSVLFIICLAIAAVSSHMLIAQEAEKSAENLRDAAILKIENKMQEVEICVKSVAGYLESTPQDDPAIGYLLTKTLVSANNDIVGSALAFRDGYNKGDQYYAPYSWEDESTGAIKSKQLGSKDYDYFSMEWYSIPAGTGKPRWSKPYNDDGGGGYLMTTYSCPVRGADGEITAILTADIKLDDISEFLSTIKPYPSSIVSLVDLNGDYINANIESKDNVKILSSKQVSDDKGKLVYKVGKKTSFAVFGPLSNGWKLFITCDYKEVLARTSLMHLILIILGIICLAALFMLCYFAIKKLTRPLVDLSDSAMHIAEGNFQTRLPAYQHDDEIGRLRDSFDFMEKSLTEYIDNLTATTAAKERIESELSIASQIQMAMLPTDFPDTDKVDLHAVLKPAKEVGGDFYDFSVSNGILHFAVGDVSGKGIPASLFMAVTRSAFHFISGLGLKMEEVVERLNNTICNGNKQGLFVTLFVGRIDLETGEFIYCNAGHNPIIINGEYLEADPNLAVGVFDNFKYKSGKTVLPGGSQLLIYTDGVTEAERSDKEEYGEDRLIEKVRVLRGKSSCQICTEIYDDVHKFTAGNDQNDDITILNINIK